jgi:hypothetical protein
MHGLMSGPNVTKVVAAMLTMGKLDIGQLRAAAENVDT